MPYPAVRRFLAGFCLVAVTALAHAAAPPAKGQAPGWYRMPLGDFEVTALSDGTVDLPVDTLLTGTTPAKVQASLARPTSRRPWKPRSMPT